MRQEGYKRSLTLKAEGEVYKRVVAAYKAACTEVMAARSA